MMADVPFGGDATGIVRIIEMKSYNKKKTVILHPVALTSPLLARFSSAYGSDLLAMGGSHLLLFDVSCVSSPALSL